jgi:D-alanine-D-alanine ligase
VQGLLELAGIPYVGPGVLGSAIGLDKDVQKRLLREAGIPVVRFKSVERTTYGRDPRIASRLADELGYPVFVKPNALGSSIGITRVKSQDGLAAALEDAFQYDLKVLIEAACEGREFECSVLGNEEPQASLPGEVRVEHGHDFYSYDSKYLDPDGASYQIPAVLPEDISRDIRALAIATFKALSLRGMARVDFLAARDLTQIYVNEVNTIPGFTSISMYPKLWEVSGLPLAGLIDRLIELALEEHRQRAALKVTYRRQPAS